MTIMPQALAYERVRIDSLKFDPRNARKHDERNIKAIMDSLSKFGQQKAIVVGDGGIVIAGNGTLEAAKRLGWDTIDVRRSGLKADEATAYAIADNRSAELAEWHDPVLGDILGELKESGWELDDLGFNDEDLKDILKQEPVPGLTDEDEVPEVDQNEFGVKRGDIWQLGNHRIMCGDSTLKENVEKLMNGEKVDILYTDPPYGVKYDESWRAEANKDNYFGGSISGQIKNDDIADWTNAFKLAEVNVAYVWHASSFAHIVRQSLIDSGFEIKQQIIWKKPFGVLSRQNYNWQHEPAWYAFKKGKSSLWADDNTQTTVWEVENPNHPMSKKGDGDVKTDHPTMKPVRLAEIAIKNHKCDSVLDLFLGSGSTLIACEKTGRKCYGMELDEHYCSVIIKRWQDFTGKVADRIVEGA